MKPEEYPITPPQGIFHFPQGIMCLIKQEDTGKESVKITRISGDEFEFEITSEKLSVAEQKDFPIRVCEYEKGLTEEELEALSEKELADHIKQGPKVAVKTEKKIDITVNNRHTQALKDGELLKVGNTITYSAGTNIITLDDTPGSAGHDWDHAYDMEDVLSACGAVVTKQGANAYDISARMYFVSGVYFKSTDEFVELRPNPSNPAYTIYQDAGAHIQLGEYNSTDKFSYNGAFWRIYLNSNSANQGNKIYGEFLVYGSSIWTDSSNHLRGLMLYPGATVRYYNSIFKYAGYFLAADHDCQDVKWFGGTSTYDMLLAVGFSHAWAGLTTMNCNYGIFFSASTTAAADVYGLKVLNSGNWDVYLSGSCAYLIRIINPVANPTVGAGGSNRPGCQVCYTFNVKVTGSNGSPIVGATVELKNNDGEVVFSEDTIAGGVLAADKIVPVLWYRHANMGGNMDYNNHTLKVSSATDEAEYDIDIDHQIKEDVVLLPQSLASYDNIMTGINDIKGTGFVKDTDSLVDIRPETDKVQTVQTATDKLQFTAGNDIKATLDSELVVTDTASRNASKATGFATINPPSQNIADYHMSEDEFGAAMDTYGNKGDYKANVANLDVAVSTRSSHADPGTPPTVREIKTEMEGVGTKLSEVLIDTAGLNGDAMRGTNNANTVVPDPAGTAPTAIENRQEMDNNSTKMAPSQTLNDYKANVSGLSPANEYDAILTDLHDEALGKWHLDPVAKTLTLYKADGVTLLKIFTLGETTDDVPNFITRTPQ